MENNSVKKRPQLPETILKNVSSDEEGFQNEVIRPIIKMISEELKVHVLHQFSATKVDFSNLDHLKRKKQLTALIQQNQQFKRELIGMVIGNFNTAELKTYYPMQKNLNKRISQIILNRMIDQLA
mgnify:CR=1 FL=1